MNDSSLMAPTDTAGMGGISTMRARGRIALLAGVGLLLEFVLLFGLMEPLSIARNPDVVDTEQPLATVLGTSLTGALRFGVPVLLAFGLMWLALWLARGLHGRAVFGVIIIGTTLYSLTLLPINPVGAHDIYHNVADARTMWRYGDNPTLLPPNAYPDDPFYLHVAAWQDFASVYGPVWYTVSGAPLPLTGDGLWANVIGQKALTAAFLLGCTALAMLIAARIRGGAMAAAGVLVGWNPLLQFETAGNGHNDVVMVFFALAAIYAVTRRWWLAVFPLLALSVGAKFVLILLGPVLLVWLLRRRDVSNRAVIASLALGALVGAAVYAPFYAGGDTLNIIQRQTSFNTSSPSALLDALLWTRLDLDPTRSSVIMKLIVMPIYLLCYAVVLWRIPRDAGVLTLVRSSFWVVFLLLVIATWWFWPWYLLMLVPLGALIPGSRPALLAAVFSASAMLMYIPYFWLLYSDGVMLQAATAGVAFLLPALLAIVPRLRASVEQRAAPVGALAGD